MKRLVFIIFMEFVLIGCVTLRDRQVLSEGTVEKIIEHRLDIFELAYQARIYNYTFSFLDDYRIYDNKPSHEWPDIKTVKTLYNERISMEIPEKLREYFIRNNFGKDAFVQYITLGFIWDILLAKKQYTRFLERSEIFENRDDYINVLNKIAQYESIFNRHDVVLVENYLDRLSTYSSGEIERLNNIYFTIIREPGDISIDDYFMRQYIKMLYDFEELNDDIDFVDSYHILMMYCNGYLYEKYHNRPNNGYILNMVQQVFNSEESEEVTQMFNKYNTENAAHKFVITGAIVQILTIKKMFLGELPQLAQYLENDLDIWIDYNDIDPYLKNVNDLLQSFDNETIQIIGNYMDSIVEVIMEGIK